MNDRHTITLDPINTDPNSTGPTNTGPTNTGPSRQPLTVSYLQWGPTDPEHGTVVLLHGGGFDSASLSWAEVGPALAATGRRVIAPDHPGYGESPLPDWPSTQANLLAYLDRFLPAVAGERYVIGGLSMGGALTLGHVLQHLHRVSGIMLLGSGGLMTRQRTAWWSVPVHLVTWLSVRSGLMKLAFDWSGRSRRLAGASLPSLIRNPARRTEALTDEILAAAQKAPAVAFTQWQRDQVLPTRLKDDYTDQLGSISCPALVVHGDHDPGVPADHARTAAAALPDAELLIVPDTGHWVQRDRPEVVIPAMVNFLDRVGGVERRATTVDP